MKTTKEKAIKDVNIKELKANYRTAFVIVAIAFLTLGLIGGYFGTIQITSQARSDWITAQNAVASKANQ